MIDALDSVRLKLDRAEKHLKVISRTEQCLRRSKEYRIICEVRRDPNMVHYVLRLPSPSAMFALIVGDCIHNIRTSLDHLIYSLAEWTASKSKIIRSDRQRKASMFPICLCMNGDFSAFDGQVKQNRLNYIPTLAQALIKGFQPTDATDLLWILNELENIDKHRKIILGTVSATELEIDTGRSKAYVGNVIVPYRDGDTVFGERVSEIGDADVIGSQMKVQLQAATFIALQDSPAVNRGVTSLIEDILKRIRNDIIPALDPFFN